MGRLFLTADKLMFQHCRQRMLAELIRSGPTPFTDLRRKIGMKSNGNFSDHASKLKHAGFIKTTKLFINDKPCTLLEITPVGRKAFLDYWRAITDVVGIAEAAA